MTVPLPIVAAVLFGACCNAAWNVVVKRGSDPFLSMVLVTLGSGLIGGFALPFLPAPAPASWPFIAASVTAQFVYALLLGAAYRAGDLSQAYPVMRGVAPVLVALASGPLIGEGLSAGRWAGVALISGGVLAMALARPGAALPRSWAATGFALANAVAIASYTLIDGIGVRLSGAPLSYAFTTFVLAAVAVTAWAAWRRGRALTAYAVSGWPVLVAGGLGSFLSYSIALWAMTRAPVAVVASLRETSILFATALSILLLKEPTRPARMAATLLIVAGAVVVRGF
jgi:drug/metabolite transporter (DMT)-like permease